MVFNTSRKMSPKHLKENEQLENGSDAMKDDALDHLSPDETAFFADRVSQIVDDVSPIKKFNKEEAAKDLEDYKDEYIKFSDLMVVFREMNPHTYEKIQPLVDYALDNGTSLQDQEVFPAGLVELIEMCLNAESLDRDNSELESRLKDLGKSIDVFLNNK